MIYLIFEPNIRTPTISVYANLESSHGFILTFVQVVCRGNSGWYRGCPRNLTLEALPGEWTDGRRVRWLDEEP